MTYEIVRRSVPPVPSTGAEILPRIAGAALRVAHDAETAIEVAVQRSRVSMQIREARGEAEVRQYLRDLGFRE